MRIKIIICGRIRTVSEPVRQEKDRLLNEKYKQAKKGMEMKRSAMPSAEKVGEVGLITCREPQQSYLYEEHVCTLCTHLRTLNFPLRNDTCTWYVCSMTSLRLPFALVYFHAQLVLLLSNSSRTDSRKAIMELEQRRNVFSIIIDTRVI